jgi:hypothetical protein
VPDVRQLLLHGGGKGACDAVHLDSTQLGRKQFSPTILEADVGRRANSQVTRRALMSM